VRGTRRLPLRGADLVLIGLAERYAGGINNAILVAETDSAPSAERVRAALDRFLDQSPWPASRLRRAFPWGRLHWVAGPRASLVPPPVREVRLAPGRSLQSFLEDEMGDRIDPWSQAPLRFSLVCEPQGERSALAMAWSRPLMDPRGAESFLSRLARLDEEPGWRFPEWSPPRETLSVAEFARVGRSARDRMKTLAPEAPVSPGRAVASPGRARFLRQAFREAQDTGRMAREVSFRLAMAGKAMADLFRRRGLPEVPFLVPVSVDLRRPGEQEPLFGNCLAFHFACFSRQATADPGQLAGVLRRDLAYAFRDGLVEANRAGMEFLRYRPLRGLLREMVWAREGDAFSFNCADTGRFAPGLERLFGTPLVMGYHLPEVLPRPGVGVFFSRFGERPGVAVGWVEGVLDEAEALGILDSIREGMGWLPIA
jgi:hypothetical protein